MSNTSTDPRRFEWSISDDIVRFRKWGTSDIYNLPEEATDCFIGTSSSCAIRLVDSKVSAQHARLMRDSEGWNLLDLVSKNGLRVDGVRHHTARLEPCMELGLGRLTLLAESVRSIELRGFLARLLGWGTEHWNKVDLALREIRGAQIRRAPFVLQGDGALYDVARDLHHYLHGREAPFVDCDLDRKEVTATVRAPLNIHDWRAALAAAQGGMLCISNSRPPRPFAEFLAVAADDCTPAVQVVICASPSQELCIHGTKPIVIPPLRSRAPEQIEHVIVEYAADAASLLGSDKPLSAEERAWVLAHAELAGAALSLGAISKAALRLTALRVEGSIPLAATRLGMARASLEKWLFRRPPPPGLTAEEVAALASKDEEDDV